MRESQNNSTLPKLQSIDYDEIIIVRAIGNFMVVTES